jgi:hypothetical protein
VHAQQIVRTHESGKLKHLLGVNQFFTDLLGVTRDPELAHRVALGGWRY